MHGTGVLDFVSNVVLSVYASECSCLQRLLATEFMFDLVAAAAAESHVFIVCDLPCDLFWFPRLLAIMLLQFRYLYLFFFCFSLHSSLVVVEASELVLSILVCVSSLILSCCCFGVWERIVTAT